MSTQSRRVAGLVGAVVAGALTRPDAQFARVGPVVVAIVVGVIARHLDVSLIVEGVE